LSAALLLPVAAATPVLAAPAVGDCDNSLTEHYYFHGLSQLPYHFASLRGIHATIWSVLIP
jgi:hypothetical protein